MPRKRKSLSASPQRRVSVNGSLSLPSSSAGPPHPPAMSNNKEEVFSSMCEMFPNLDPALVEMVLSEYKEVGIVMDYLLELSTAAKANTQESTGFTDIVSFPDDFQNESQGPENFQDVPNQVEVQQDVSSAGNDLDTLLDQALNRYGLNNEDLYCSPEQYEDTSLLHPLELDQQSPSFRTEHTPLIDLSKEHFQREDYTCALDSDFATSQYEKGTSLGVAETDALANVESDSKTGPDTIFDSLNSSKSKAIYPQDNVEKPTEANQQNTGPISTSSHVLPPPQCASPKFQTKWNPMANSFYPTANVNPTFISPVAVNPSQWTFRRREPVAGGSYNPPPIRFVWNVNQFTQIPCSADNIKPISKAPSGPQASKKVTPFVGKVLVLLRGAPGSGKSTLARSLLQVNPTGVILSTDDYFRQNGVYLYDISRLGEAHEWNHRRAKEAFEKNTSPIIIDNTNLQGWEMKPYVSMAVKQKYKVIFREPDTWWKSNPKELERRNQHGVKKEKIIKMLEHFEHVTVNSLLNLSHPKTSKNTANSQRKTDENNGDNMSDTGSSAPATQKSLEVSKDGPECFPDAAGLEVKNLSIADNDYYTEILQLVPTINIDNDDCANNDASVEVTVDQQGLDKNSGSFLLTERPELLNFVGDWPVEQTMSQRAPRSRKARARPEKHNLSVQESGENDKSINPDSEQIDTANDQEQIDNRASKQDELEEAVALNIEDHIDSSTVNSDGEEHLLGLENQFCTSLTLHNKEDCAENEDKPEAVIVKIYELPEPVAECTNGEDIQGLSSVNEDVKVKPRPPRRSCKLALNFTNHCSITPKPKESECFQQPIVDLCKFSQTEPQDFALAWRIEKKNVDVLDSAKIIIGKSSNFKSQSLDDRSEAQENIPYRVMHHKSTFVVEDDIISLGDQDSLIILCKLFRSLSFDVLKDLFERCNKDIEWTTNLLLDSGEKIYKEEECEVVELEDLESCSHSHKDNSSEIPERKSAIIAEEVYEHTETGSTDHSLKASEYSPFVNALPLVVAEELKNGNVLSSNEINLNRCRFTSELQERFLNPEPITDTIVSDISWPSDLEIEHGNTYHSSSNILQSTDPLKTITKGNKEEINLNNSNLSMKLDIRRPEILVGENNEAQEVLEVIAVVEEETKTQNESNARSRSKESLQFDYLELALPPEFAFQLTELFGPVGIDPGSLTIEDCVVPIDLKLAECIHKKWKESVMERHRQEALSCQLILQDSIHDDQVNLNKSLQESESGVSQRETDLFPFMDQWNTRINKVSLREIIAEEMAIQAHEDSKKAASSKNCAVKLKEKQLLELFPHVEQQLLLDIFKENDYNLEKTEQFMSSVLEADPVRNVIAQGFKQAASTATEKSKEKKLKSGEELLNERYFQDFEYPNYNDFRAEAFLYHQKQQESYRKAAEAHHRGMKQVAAYYAQQGYLYGLKMKEENRRAAVQIFERANEYLLPENILDLHGLHVDEAMKHLRKVLQEKTDEFKQNGGKPHLLVITGRGNHSQGGVPRIKPAVMDFLTNHDYRFQEKTPGVLRINLK